jgi:four helix bundle protein
MQKENIALTKSFDFALKSIELYKLLLKKNEFVISKQFLKSATSIGANAEEANAGYSKKDFGAKMGVSSKEARETMYWLRLLEASNFIEFDYKAIKSDCEELIRLFTAIVKSTQENLK